MYVPHVNPVQHTLVLQGHQTRLSHIGMQKESIYIYMLMSHRSNYKPRDPNQLLQTKHLQQGNSCQGEEELLQAILCKLPVSATN